MNESSNPVPVEWRPIANEGPGYQEADLPGHRGFVGPDGDTHWTWAIQVGDQPQEFGEAPTEAEAKAAVENWTPKEEA